MLTDTLTNSLCLCFPYFSEFCDRNFDLPFFEKIAFTSLVSNNLNISWLRVSDQYANNNMFPDKKHS